MRLLGAFVRYELLFQWRSVRGRLGALLYVLLCLVGPAAMLSLRDVVPVDWGAMSYLRHVGEVQPFLTFLLAALLAGGRMDAEARRQELQVLSASPIGNARYLFGRWLAVGFVLTGLTLLPPLLASLLAAIGGLPSTSPIGAMLGPWALGVLPLAWAAVALWMGLRWVFRSELGSLIALYLLTTQGLTLVNQGLFRLGFRLGGPRDWLGIDRLAWWLQRDVLAWMERDFADGTLYFVASEGAYDLRSALDWALPRASLLVAASLCALLVATAYLGRTRPDVSPLRIDENHPLRSLLRLRQRLRQRYARDAALSAVDRSAALVGPLILLLAIGASVLHQSRVLALAGERYRAETSTELRPLPVDVETRSWRVGGALSAWGPSRLEASIALRNGSDREIAELSFGLNSALRIEAATAEGRSCEISRYWDRLGLRLRPALAPGEEVELRFRMSGVPGERVFPLNGVGWQGFLERYERLDHVRFARDVSDLSRGNAERRIGRRGIDLRAEDLAPVPRYSSWDLVANETTGRRDRPEESTRITTEAHLDLRPPSGMRLFASCGGMSDSRNEARLIDTCHLDLRRLRVVGGPLRVVTLDDGQARIAALPAHAGAARRHLESLVSASELSERVWPGLGGFRGVTAVERPPPFSPDPRAGIDYRSSGVDVVGNLLLFDEWVLTLREPFPAERLASEVLVSRTLEKRSVDRDHTLLLEKVIENLMVRRMRGGPEGGATVSGKPWLKDHLRKPLLGARSFNRQVWKLRLPAVLHDLEQRVGREALFVAVAELLEEPGSAEEPLTVDDLFAAWEARGQVSLERFYADYVTGEALPELRLEEVASARVPGGFRVTGQLRNVGTGEAVCPVIVKGVGGERERHVTVDSTAAAAFAFDLPWRPERVELDPQRRCHRWVDPKSFAFERVRLEDEA